MRTRNWNCILLICFLSSCQRTPQKLVLVELEQADGIHKGTELRYRGVLAGHVESITSTEPQKNPLARVALASESPTLAAGDEFRLAASGMLGDVFIAVIPATSPGAPLPNGATVKARGGSSVSQLRTDQIPKMFDGLNLLAALQDLPEIKRVEVLEKMRKLLDDAKKESTNK